MRKEIIPLTSIRGLAALWVVALHFTGNTERVGFPNLPVIIRDVALAGGFGVDIFFLLSGYILMLNYGVRTNYAEFLWFRFARVFPLHLAVLAAMVVGVEVMSLIGTHTNDPEFFSLGLLPYHITLTFVWLGMPLAWNSQTWSLSAEIVAYLCFPAIQFLIRSISRPVLLAVTGGLLVAQGLWLYAMGEVVTGGPAVGRALFGFMAGAALRISTQTFALPLSAAVVSGAAVVALAAWSAAPLAVFPSAVLLVVLAAPHPPALLAHPLIKWAGDISYSIYLLHVPLLIIVLMAARHFRLDHAAAGIYVLGVGYLLTLLAISHLAWRFIEKPARNTLRRFYVDRAAMNITEAKSESPT